jgi:hypothetical protein
MYYENEHQPDIIHWNCYSGVIDEHINFNVHAFYLLRRALKYLSWPPFCRAWPEPIPSCVSERVNIFVFFLICNQMYIHTIRCVQKVKVSNNVDQFMTCNYEHKTIKKVPKLEPLESPIPVQPKIATWFRVVVPIITSLVPIQRKNVSLKSLFLCHHSVFFASNESVIHLYNKLLGEHCATLYAADGAFNRNLNNNQCRPLCDLYSNNHTYLSGMCQSW